MADLNNAAAIGVAMSASPWVAAQARMQLEMEQGLTNCMMLGADPDLVREHVRVTFDSLETTYHRLAAGELDELIPLRMK